MVSLLVVATGPASATPRVLFAPHSWNEGVAPLAFVTQRRFEISVPVMATTISDDLDHRFQGIVKVVDFCPESLVGLAGSVVGDESE